MPAMDFNPTSRQSSWLSRVFQSFLIMSVCVSIFMFLFHNPYSSKTLIPGLYETIRIGSTPDSEIEQPTTLQHVKKAETLDSDIEYYDEQIKVDPSGIETEEKNQRLEEMSDEVERLREESEKLREEVKAIREAKEKMERESQNVLRENEHLRNDLKILRENFEKGKRKGRPPMPMPLPSEAFLREAMTREPDSGAHAPMGEEEEEDELEFEKEVVDIMGGKNAAPKPPGKKKKKKAAPKRLLDYVSDPPEFDIPNPTRNQSNSLTPEVCVIAPWHRSGLYNDMHVYMSAFTDVKLIETISLMKKRRCTLCIQLSSGQIYYDYMKYCKTQAIMINVEWASKYWYWERFDFVFAKTNHTMFLFTEYWNKYLEDFPQFKAPQMIFTKHTYLEQAPYHGSENLDYTLIAHLSGESVYKSTDLVVQSWLGIKDRKGKRLVISCFGQCRDYVKLEKHTGRYKEEVYLDVKRLVFPNDSLTIYVERMPDVVYSKVLETAGYYLCPSRIEGYGMYIDDARSRGAVILTTDNWPMNELVTPENGYLVAYGPRVSSKGIFGSKEYHLKIKVDKESLKDGIKRMIAEDRDVLVKKGTRSRELWARDSAHFYSEMARVLEMAKAMNETADIESDYLMYTEAPTKKQTTCPTSKKTDKATADACVGWRQTGGCKPTGKREPKFDQDCNACIPPNKSGFCLCSENRHIGFSCHHEHLRCLEICAKMTSPRNSGKVLCPTLQEVSSTPRETRHQIWDDPKCQSGCTLVGHCGDSIPCCVKPKGVPKSFWGTDLLPENKEASVKKKP